MCSRLSSHVRLHRMYLVPRWVCGLSLSDLLYLVPQWLLPLAFWHCQRVPAVRVVSTTLPHVCECLCLRALRTSFRPGLASCVPALSCWLSSLRNRIKTDIQLRGVRRWLRVDILSRRQVPLMLSVPYELREVQISSQQPHSHFHCGVCRLPRGLDHGCERLLLPMWCKCRDKRMQGMQCWSGVR